MECEYSNCGRQVLAKGLCDGHYTQKRRGKTLSALNSRRRGAPAGEWLWLKTEEQGSCQVWTGSVNRDGYAMVHHQGRTVQAHRLAYELSYGPIPAGAEVDHSCLIRSCLRPSHLRLVTRKQNMENRNLPSNNTSGYRGVTREHGKWIAQVNHNGKVSRRRGFATASEASDAAIEMRNELFTHNNDMR